MAQDFIHTILWWVVGGCLTAIVCVLVILYFRGTFRDRVEYKVKNAPSPEDARFPLALASLSNSVMTSGRSTNFWLESEQINAARLEAIRSAKQTIHFETFFMTPGCRANDFATAIAEKAQAGVKVQVIVDKYGVKTLPQRYWKRLQAAGIEVRFFNDFNWRSPIDYFARSHRKLLIIDGEFALIGGAGISDYWDGKDNIHGDRPWYDFETRLEGDVVAVLAGMFMQHWTVEIYEYQPSMMHAKALLLDDRWLSTGSANFDPRSFFHNDELDISTSDMLLVKCIEQLLIQGFAKSKQVSFSEWRKRPLWQRALAKIVLFFESQL